MTWLKKTIKVQEDRKRKEEERRQAELTEQEWRKQEGINSWAGLESSLLKVYDIWKALEIDRILNDISAAIYPNSRITTLSCSFILTDFEWPPRIEPHYKDVNRVVFDPEEIKRYYNSFRNWLYSKLRDYKPERISFYLERGIEQGHLHTFHSGPEEGGSEIGTVYNDEVVIQLYPEELKVGVWTSGRIKTERLAAINNLKSPSDLESRIDSYLAQTS